MKTTISLGVLFFLSITIFAQSPCPGLPSVVHGGKVYNTVLIGTQCWLKENLAIGSMITAGTSQTNNSVIEKYCYGNDTNNCAIYGGMYQWAEAVQYIATPGAQGICPAGWHIPVKADYLLLSATAGYNTYNYLAVGQDSGNNSTGFSAMLAGFCLSTQFGNLGVGTSYWSSGEMSAQNAYVWYPGLADSAISSYGKNFGISIRCVNNTLFTAVDDNTNRITPSYFALAQNYPNPFNPATVIEYQLPQSVFVRLIVYDVLGKEVALLVNQEQSTGYHSYSFDGSRLSSGLYICTLQAGTYTGSIKMLLAK